MERAVNASPNHSLQRTAACAAGFACLAPLECGVGFGSLAPAAVAELQRSPCGKGNKGH